MQSQQYLGNLEDSETHPDTLRGGHSLGTLLGKYWYVVGTHYILMPNGKCNEIGWESFFHQSLAVSYINAPLNFF